MKVSQNCVDIVKHFEKGPNGKWAERPYLCPAKKWTVGYGHVILEGEFFKYPMDENTANVLLMMDLNKFTLKVIPLLKVPVSQQQFDALVSMAFNTGVGKADGIKGDFADSTLLALVNEGKFQLAAAEFGRWIFGGGKILNGLIRRRKSEAYLFTTGQVKFF